MENKNAKASKKVNANNFIVTGVICKNNLKVDREKGYARFTVARNMGSVLGTLFTDCIMFDSNFSKKVDIPYDKIVPGQLITVSGFLKTNFYQKDGKTVNGGNDYIVLSATPHDEAPEKGENRFCLTGHVCEQGLIVNEEKGFVRMSIGHNQGKNVPSLFADIFVNSRNGNKNVDIPFADIKKGAYVKVEGYRKSNSWEKDGKTMHSTDFVAVAISCLSSKEEVQPKEQPAKKKATSKKRTRSTAAARATA